MDGTFPLKRKWARQDAREALRTVGTDTDGIVRIAKNLLKYSEMSTEDKTQVIYASFYLLVKKGTI